MLHARGMAEPGGDQGDEEPSDLCPVCAALATPHCTGGHCVWLTCTGNECGTTWHPARPEILLRPPQR